MKRKISFVLIFCMFFSFIASSSDFTLTANAQEMMEECISALFDEMTENIALALVEDDESAIQDCEMKIAKIERQLEALGVNELTSNELEQFFEEEGLVTPNWLITKPENSDTVKWYLYNYIDYSYNSKKYNIQRLIAVGNNPGGMLVTGEDNYRFYSDKEKLANAVETAVSIYVQKGISCIPIIRWTPYELLFSSSPSNAFNSSYVTHRCVSSIVFSYVKESSMSDNYYSLSLFSNKISIAVHAHGAAVVNSVPSTYSKQETDTISADYYNSIVAAIKAYLGETGQYDYVTYYEIRSYDNQYKRKAYVPTPMAGPGQIY